MNPIDVDVSAGPRRYPVYIEAGLTARLAQVEPRPATPDELTAVHTPGYVAALKQAMSSEPKPEPQLIAWDPPASQ